jgi:hypothetical protein
MNTIHGETPVYRYALGGTVTPPADMIDAARKSLPADQFEELMRQTGGTAPTPAQLCALVDALNAQ